MKIAFLGDISLNDNYTFLYKDGEKPFEEIGQVLKSNDYVIGNLESLSVGSCGENVLKNPRLKTNQETLNYLSDIGLNVALLANNHAYDNLKDGFEKTVSFLDGHFIKHLGASTAKGEERRSLVLNKDGVSVCLLNYVSKDTNPSLPDDADVYLNFFDEENVIEDIQRSKSLYDYVLVLLHWGGRCEGGMYPDWDQPSIARRLVDEGADMIIGGHSHTVQPYELYKGKYIFYSLGNFCFSDIKNDNGTTSFMDRKKNCFSFVPLIELSNNSIAVNEMFTFRNRDGVVVLTGRPKFSLPFFSLIKRSKVCWKLYYFISFKISPMLFFFLSRNMSFKEKCKRMDFIKIKRLLMK